MCAAMQVDDDIHACSFCLSKLGGLCEPWDGLFDVCLGACVRGDKVRYASGECEVSLVNSGPQLSR